jgi:hypothetical protein
MGDRTREAIRLELMLEDASIKLSSVASSLNTVSARLMLGAMIEGESDPVVLANMAQDTPGVLMSSGGFWFGDRPFAVAPRGGLVVAGAGLEAAVQDADQAAGQSS